MPILTGTSKSRFVDFEDPSNPQLSEVIKNSYGAAKKLLSQIDSMISEDTFVEDGIQDIPGFSNFDAGFSNIKEPSRRKVYTQTPRATVFIKKRLFSTLRSNFDQKFMGIEDKVFIRASKHLFRRKCDEISFYENLTKLERINDNPGFLKIDGVFSETLDSLFNLLNVAYGITGLENTVAFFQENLSQPEMTNVITNGTVIPPDFSSLDSTKGAISKTGDIIKTLYKLKQINERSKGSNFTRWVYDSATTDVSGLGPGVGVIELCLVSNVNASTSLSSSEGGCSLDIEDPYKLTLISESDIEIALRQALAEEGGQSGFLDTSGAFQLEQAMELDRQLNEMRRIRRVSEVNFEFVFGSSNAIGKIINSNTEFDQNTIYTLSGDDRFTLPEELRAVEILNKLSSYLTLKQRSAGVLQNLNKNFNSVRQRMRNEYAGHSIIQPMDSIHVFINSNTRDESVVYDNRIDIVAGNLLEKLTEKYDILSNEAIEQEAASYGVDPSLYKLVRDNMSWRNDGVSVFAGIAQTINQTYTANNGSFKLSVDATTNMEYLRMTRLNTAPSLGQPTKFLDDPLTPFDVDTDKSSGLIIGTPTLSDENVKKLPWLRFDDGFYLGDTVDTALRLFQDAESNGTSSRIFYQHVPGLSYKWKTGILTETLNVNVSRPLNGEGNALNDNLSTVPPLNYASPFANLDAADVMSILVTGQPYNYANFLKNSMEMGTFSIDNAGNKKHYFNHYFDLFERNRPIVGNFIPAKNSVIDPKDAVNSFSIMKTVKELNSSIQKLQKELAEVQDLAKTISQVSDQPDPSVLALNEKIQKLQTQLAGKQLDAQSAARQSFGGNTISVVGNNVLLNVPDQDLTQVNRQIAYNLKRKPEEVRYNQDKNYFVVSSQYDQDTDIQAFAVALKDAAGSLMSSDYKKPFDLATMTASSLNFEFFCDTNGNIIFRPPEYNKVPLSLLLKMISLSKGDGISLAPRFVLDLFEARANTVEQRLLQVELEIHEKLLLLDLLPETVGIKSLLQNDGNLDDRDASSRQGLQSVTAPYILNTSEAVKQSLEKMQDVFPPSSRSNLTKPGDAASVRDRSQVIDSILRVRNSLNTINGRTDRISDRTAEVESEISEELNKLASATAGSQVARLNLTDNLGAKISERQLLLQTYSRLLKNKYYFAEADDAIVPRSIEDHISTSWNTYISGEADTPKLPQILRDLVENDLSNDDGPRSGKRYVINDDVIITSNFRVKIPEFNRVKVTGNSDQEGRANLVGAPSGIPNLFSAEAVDFDSWRQYGFRDKSQELHRVDFTNAETQCAPYAVFKLLEERKKIHAGQVTVIGNEFYQPGDVVYINDKSMLYYVTKVAHTLSLGDGSFKTTLDLEYGRALGEYIPTPLDVIGKGMLSSQRRAYGNIGTKRFSMSSSSTFVLDTLIAPNYLGFDAESGSERNLFYSDQFLKENLDRVRNIMTRASSKINDGNKDYYRIELRGYYIRQAEQPGGEPAINTNVNSTALLRMAAMTFLHAFNSRSTDSVLLPERVVVIPPINITKGKDMSDEDKELRRFPSANAWSMANSVINIDGVSLPLNVVDIVFVVDKSVRGDTNPALAGTSIKNIVPFGLAAEDFEIV